MQYDKLIAKLVSGDDIEGFYMLKNATQKLTNAGKPYLNAVLADRSGTIEAKVWDYTGPIGTADEGEVVKIRGSVSEYRGTPQVTVERIRLADANDPVDVSALMPVAPINTDVTLAEVVALVDTVADDEYRLLAQTLLHRHYDSFKRIPAAKSVHHGFLNGLLMHTANMLRLADFLAKQYADTVDRSLLLAGTLLHDLHKDQEFAFSRFGLVTEYSMKGQLLGHLVMGAQEIAEIARELGVSEQKSALLQHMVLSHHGEPEHGAALRPICAESELLSYIDLIDSRMEIYRENFAEMEVGAFTRVYALEKKIYKHTELAVKED